MSRIRQAYENMFRALLRQLGSRRLELGVRWCMIRALGAERLTGPKATEALAGVYAELRQKTWKFRRRRPRGGTNDGPPKFFCDAGLGGLARWLRAAGYAADWQAGMGDTELIRLGQRESAIVVTTDAELLERRAVREGKVQLVWLPPAKRASEQLESILGELRLPVLSPRCMKCGGELLAVNKESVKSRIPPRTYRWIDEYFACSRCRQLFWEGTHWRRIGQTLKKLSAAKMI